MDSNTLGSRLKTARENAGLTQDGLSDKAGLAYSTLAKIEQGAIKNPSIFTVAAIAQALEVTVDSLLTSAPVLTDQKTNHAAIKFIYCDMNGVLVRFFHHAFVSLAEEADVSFDRVESTFWHYNDAANRGEMALEEFNEAMARQLNVERVDWERHYMAAVQPITEMHEYLKTLHHDYKVGLLTNTMPGFIDTMRQQGLMPDFDFDVVIDSSVIGAVKPEEKIYLAAEKAAGVAPEQIFFIDDSRANLTAAERRGWRVFWFDDFSPEESIGRIGQALKEHLSHA